MKSQLVAVKDVIDLGHRLPDRSLGSFGENLNDLISFVFFWKLKQQFDATLFNGNALNIVMEPPMEFAIRRDVGQFQLFNIDPLVVGIECIAQPQERG
jgi:hypothetical protein